MRTPIAIAVSNVIWPRADAEDLSEQDVGGRGGETPVERQQVDPDTEAEGQDHPDRGVPFTFAIAEQSHGGGYHDRSEQCAQQRIVGYQQAGRRARERQFGGTVHRKREVAHDDERPNQPCRHRDEGCRDQRMLDETLRKVIGQSHGTTVSSPCRWW